MSAFEEKLFVVYHDGVGTNDNQQLSYLLYDCDARKSLAQATLPLSPQAELRWVGFGETGLPGTMDSEEVLRVLVTAWDNLWTPIAELKALKSEKQKLDYYWPVGFTNSELLCITCKGGETFPKVLPKPTLSTVALQMPVVGLPETAANEEAFLRSKIMLDHTLDAEDWDELNPTAYRAIMQQHKALDRHLLAAISRSVQSQRASRALDIATCLLVPSSVEIAIKIAVKSKMSNLAERMSTVKVALETSLIQRRRQLRLDRMGPSRARPTQHMPVRTHDEVEEQEVKSHHINLMDQDEDDVPTSEPSRISPSTPSERPSVLSNMIKASKDGDKPQAKRPKAVNPFAKRAAPAITPTRTVEEPEDEESQEQGVGEEPVAKKEKPAFSLKVKAKKPKDSKPKPKQKLSKYMNWLKQNRQVIKKDHPDCSVTELAKMAGQLWKKMSPEEQNEWIVQETA